MSHMEIGTWIGPLGGFGAGYLFRAWLASVRRERLRRTP
jgi:biotin transporter BioY